MARTQEQRDIAIHTPLGKDVLLLQKADGFETLGQMFRFELELLSENNNILFTDIVGRHVTLRLKLSNGDRYFNGYLSRFVQTEGRGVLAHYQATLVPWLWFLTRTADCRIFQGKTVPAIIQEIFSDHGFTHIRDELTGDYRTWDYCAQYRETDYHFVNRLMEQEGIYYFFEHDAEKHTLVLADCLAAHGVYPGYEKIRHLPASEAGGATESISDWVVESNIQPGMFALNDFNFEKVRVDLRAVGKDPAAISERVGDQTAADFEVFDYPGEYTDYKYGEKYAQTRIEELQAQKVVCKARSDARGVMVGCWFELTHFPRSDQNRTYLITSATYRMSTDSYESDSPPAAVEPIFTCNFTAISTELPYRPRRITPLPMIRGPQTATVVGPKGEKVYTDKYGRVKVQFHWDRYGKSDENSSCWIRVSQNWAGKHWGGMAIPHIGQEVIVEFLEGDPDHPLITGRVYNADNMPPLELPDNKHKSIFRDDYGNELVFDGTPGDEHITLFSPHHSSGLSLGKSCNAATWSDSDNAVLGAKNELTIGTKNDTVLGNKSEATIGLSQDYKAGGFFEAKAGWTASITADAKVNFSCCDEFDVAGDDYLLRVGDRAWIDAQNRLQLVSGDQQQAVIKMTNAGLKLMSGNKNRMPGFGSSELMIKEFKNASLFYLVLAGALHAANATAFLVTARKDDTRNWIEAGFGAGQTALSVVLLGFVLRIAKKLRDNLDVDKIAANFDGAPDYTTKAKIELKNTGEIIIEKETSSIQIDSGGNILLTTAGEIKLKSNSINAQDAQKVMMGVGGALTIG